MNGNPSSAEVRPIPKTDWDVEQNVTCVVCPGCAFTFAAYHVCSDGSGYSCPECGHGNWSHPGRGES